MTSLLLTGGTWYIWSHCCVDLLRQGYEIVIIDNLSNSSQDVVEKIETLWNKKITFLQGDIRNKNLLREIFQKHDISWVIHFAGAKAVWVSCSKPFEYYENNVVWTLHLCEIMDEYNVRDIIFSSSATVYDPWEIPPFWEDSLTWNTTNPYGTTKLIIENILRDLSIHKKFRVWNLRYFNPVGAHSSGLIWEDPDDIPNNLLPYIMKVANWELSELSVFWNDYDTLDGTGIRDYIHVLDLAKWHIAALKWLFASLSSQERDWESGLFETFNLWTGKWTSVLEMISYTQDIIWKPLPYKITARRVGDIASAYCKKQKAEEILWWEAKKTVKQAIEDSWNFIQTKQWK